jgi:hypothetical protein
MTDTGAVTPLRPDKVKDPTGPIRSRRARQKRNAAATAEQTAKLRFANEIKADDTVAMLSGASATPASDAPAKRISWSVWPLAGTTGRLDGGVADASIRWCRATHRYPGMAGVGHGSRNRLHVDLSRSGNSDGDGRGEAGHREGWPTVSKVAPSSCRPG